MNRQYTIPLFLAFLIWSGSLLAENQFSSFNGGKENIRLSYYSSLFTGPHARFANLGSTVSSAFENPAAVVVNPAAMGFQSQSMFAISISPNLMFDVSGMADLQSGIDEAVDDFLADMKAPGLVPKYPQIGIEGGQDGVLNGFFVTMVFPGFGNLGVSYHRKLDIQIDMMINGMAITVTDSSVVQDNGNEYVEKTVVPLGIEGFSDLRVHFHQMDVAFGRKISPKLSIGFGLNVINGCIRNNLDVRMDGILRSMSSQTDIYAVFNDPSVDYRNDLNNSMKANFSLNIVRPRVALSYRPADWLYLDAVYLAEATRKFDGRLEIIQHTLGALNLDYDEEAGEEMFDLNQLKPSQATYTNRDVYYSDNLELSLPGSFALGLGVQKKWFTAVLSYEKPFGSFSGAYTCDRYRDGQKKTEEGFIAYADTTQLSYKISLEQKHIMKIGLGLGLFSLGGQVILGDIRFDGFKDDEGNPTEPILNTILGGSFAMGIGFHITPQLAADINLIAIPGPIAMTSFTYTF